MTEDEFEAAKAAAQKVTILTNEPLTAMLWPREIDEIVRAVLRAAEKARNCKQKKGMQ